MKTRLHAIPRACGIALAVALLTIPSAVNADVALQSDESSPWTQDGSGVWSSPALANGQYNSASFTVTGPCVVRLKYKLAIDGASEYDAWSAYFYFGYGSNGVQDDWQEVSSVVSEEGEAEVYVGAENYSDGTLTAYVKDITTDPMATATVGDLEWTYSCSESAATVISAVTVDEGYEPDGDVAVPATLGGKPVTEVADGFLQNTGITSLTFPDSVTKIGSMVAVRCGSLESVSFGAGLASIGDRSFLGNEILESFTVSDANPNYASYAGGLYNKAKTVLLQFPGGKSTFEVAPTTTEIGEGACEMASGLRGIVIPGSVKRIGNNSFQSCGLVSVELEEGVEEIGDGAFSNCQISMLKLPSSLATIGEYAFMYASVTSLTLPSGLKNIGAHAFESCYSLTTLVVPTGIETIGEYAFGYCESLTSVYLPKALQGTLNVATVFGSSFDSSIITWYETLPYHTVTLDANYAGGAQTQLQVLNAIEELPVPASRTGYAFSGWWSDPTDEDEAEQLDAGDEITGNATYYAHWVTESRFTFGGDVAWVAADSDDGAATTIQSGPLGYGETSDAFASVSGTGQIGVRYLNSSYSDKLCVYVDGEKFASFGYTGGNVIYGYVDVLTPGNHTVTFSYENESGDRDSYAQIYDFWWTPQASHTVTLNANGGTGVPATLTVLGTLPALPMPSKDDCIFAGWYTAAEGGTRAVAGTEVTGDMTLYARWADAPFTMGGAAGWFVDDDGNYRSEALAVGQQLYAETTFTGPCRIAFDWQASMSNYSYDRFTFSIDGVQQDSLSGGNSPRWRSISYNITREGEHVFRWEFSRSYWSSDNASYENCVWLRNIQVGTSYTVTLDPNYDGGTPRDIDLFGTLGDLWTPERYDYYQFAGWFTAPDDGTQVTPDTPVTAAVTYYAHWTAVPYIFTGGIWTETSPGTWRSPAGVGSYTYCSATKEVEGPCTVSFDWNMPVNSGNNHLTLYVDGNIVGDSVYAPGSDTMEATITSGGTHEVMLEYYTGYYGNTEAYLEFSNFTVTELPSYTVTFDRNDGSSNTFDVKVPQGMAIGELPEVSCAGYAFKGWFTAATGGTKLTSDTVLTGNATYYAQWAETPFTFSGTKPWTIDDDGSMRSGAIRNYNDTSVATTTFSGPCVVTFDWKSSTAYSGWYLYYTVDGVQKGSLSGITDWASMTSEFSDAQSHTIEFKLYINNSYQTGGENCVWVRNFTVTPVETSTVTFEPNYESAGAATTTSVITGNTVVDTPAVWRDGYVMTGWWTAAEGGQRLTAETVIEDDITYYAQWEATDFTFSGTKAWTKDVDGFMRAGRLTAYSETSVATIEVEGPCIVTFDWKIVSPDWNERLYFDVDDSNIADLSGNLGWYSRTQKFSDSKTYTLTFRYEKNSYGTVNATDGAWLKDFTVTPVTPCVVTFNQNYSGAPTAETRNVIEGESVGTLPEPVRYGYAFQGWWTAAEGGDQVWYYRTINEDVTFYAHWVESKSFTATGGDANWTIDGEGIWHSGEVSGDGATSWASLTVEGPCTVSFYWKTTYNYNSLSVSLDGGDPITSIGGYMTYWGNSQVVIDTAGEHTVTWTHTKTSDYNSGSDFGLVKDVVVTPKTFYSVRWNNWDGSEIMTDMVEEGTRPYYNGEEPTRAADAQYEYSFIGWSPATDYIYADTVYTAQFYQNPRSYQITWKDDDGTTIDTTSVAYGTTPTHANPKKSGYRFVGWFTAVEGGEKLTSETTVTGEATYYARWEEREGGWENFHETGGSVNAETGEEIGWTVVTAVEKDGDEIGSWRSGEITHSQETWASVDVTGPCKVTFEWKVSSESASYDYLYFKLDNVAVDGIANIGGTGGDWSEVSFTITGSGTHTLKWTYRKDGSVSDGSDCGWVKNLDVVAITTHDVTFQPNYQGSASPVILSVEDGTAVGELPVLSRSGYAMTGWWTAATGGDKITSATVISADETYYAQWAETDFTFSGTKPWTIESDGSMRSGAIGKYNETSIATITVTGPCAVTFDWMTSASSDYGFVYYVDGSPVTSQNGSSAGWQSATKNFADSGSHAIAFSFSRNSSYYADGDYFAAIKDFTVTTIEPWTVTFSPNYEDAGPATTRPVADGEAIGELPVVARDGYIFTGWFTAATGGTQITAETPVTSNMIVYAQWVKSVGDITYELHDSYGDGWNGCAISVVNVDTESVIATLTIPSGSYEASGTIPVVSGMTLRFVWVAGSYVSETSYTIKGIDGTVILSGEGEGFTEPVVYAVPAGEPETPETPIIEIDTEKMDAPAEDGHGNIVIEAKEGKTLTQTDVDNLEIMSPTEPAVEITEAYVKALDTEANAIVMRLADPDVDPVGGASYAPATEDATGLLDDADAVEAAGALAAKPETSGDEEVGALPVKMYPGLWYQASWGSGLGSDSLTPGVKFRAESGQTHIGVIKQKGTSGFYKIDVFEK